MLDSRIQKKIPLLLGHHTNYEALCSILSHGLGKDREICLWAFSNMCKNDPNEIKMGLRLQEIVNEQLKTLTKSFLFQNTRGYKDSASISFMAGESTTYMKKEYGCFRLNFDLGAVENFGLADFLECEYVDARELEEYGKQYAEMVVSHYQDLLTKKNSPERFQATHLAKVIDYIYMDVDLLRKPLIVKELRWKQECEWRKLLQLSPDDKDIYYQCSNPYKKVYYPLTSLNNITILFEKGKKRELVSNYLRLLSFFIFRPRLWSIHIKTKCVNF